ncbi:UDP-N-acetylmuramoyl-L-alanyl-D-glutamate--2,6-diaminopimelate ligase [Ottowia testudinis]|uniref:UDP-N-acetylmuramoyl-L-alanyl-D-glutamate--2,6-diaminopimelate ligase n=1 Tax=Ottowia testudinis TaxID=2816950 RepID=A0A975H346_9BURK|nr:UDP-N-acetylmuramoyl-L-alanyl-D-glutamate--2,6-diaminopimelate ligase [Ottowia testudinis]QTD44880.1 UDP-N-acetylmuramoyl-L-alanyl-D-glutamate--2,6-diaminopimelate ligase [Ottowia testudinis]
MTTALHTPQDAARWLRARVTGVLHADSRRVEAGDGFIAWPGAAADGRRYVNAALTQGASACVVEQVGAEAFGFDQPEVATYAQLKAATGPIAAAYYQTPSESLNVVAITGTNGKTSTAWWLAWALSKSELTALAPCALVGTLGVGLPVRLEATGMTTPDPVLLQQRLRGFVDAGARSCAIEASSIGIVERRLDGTAIRVAVFTNFTQDHLDYHGSMDAYWRAKAELFNWPDLRAAVICLDDPRGAELARQAEARGLDVWTVSRQHPARLRAVDVSYGECGLAWGVREGERTEPLHTELVGGYNVANLMCVLGTLRALGMDLTQAVAACTGLPAVPGRMERIDVAGAPLAVVDYAHTPDAVDQALQALRPLAARRGGRLWCVLGCGGNRDSAKRPLMAAAAERQADRVVLTSDNPRDEEPRAIIDAMRAGLRRAEAALVQIDRAEAIALALAQAAPVDVVLIAGKGHEDYQEVRGQRLPFSDQAVARRVLAQRAASAEASA